MASIRDIAQRAGVSISTVSRVMNNAAGVGEAAREAVLAAVHEVGYVPEVGRRSTSNIAIVYADTPTLESPFDAALLAGVYSGLEYSDSDLLILDYRRSRHPGETMSQMLIRKGVRGALIRTTAETARECVELVAQGFPAVVVGSRPETPAVPFAHSDSRTASREAVEHLIALGHRRIAVAAHVVDDSDHADRIAGYRDALEAAGLDFDERLVFRVTADRAGGSQVLRRRKADSDPPSAVYLTDPLLAVGLFEEARKTAVHIPGDLSVVGFDDGELRHTLVPQLTAVCQNTPLLGRTAVELLLKLLSGESKSARPNEVLRCWFEIHESTGPAPSRRRKN